MKGVRTISITLCAVLIVVFCVPLNAQQTNGITASVPDVETLSVSAAYGHVVEAKKGSGDTLVICIRDRHVDPVAQLNIARLLDELTRTYDANLICLEGASKPLDTSYYDSFPAGETKNKVVEYFVHQGFFTGAEYFKILSPDTEIHTVGVEDRETYLQHIQNYDKNQYVQNLVQEYIQGLQQAVAVLKDKEYSSELNEIEALSKQHGAHEIELAELLNRLSTLAKQSGVSLNGYPHLDRYSRLLAMERSIDFSIAEQQREQLIQTFSKTLDTPYAEQLIAETMRFKLRTITTGKYYEYLYSLYLYLSAIRQKIMPDEYQELVAYIDYIAFARSINFLRVDAEFDSYLLAVQRGLCETPAQERLVVFGKSVDVLADMAALKLSHTMLRSIEENPYTYDLAAISQFILEASKTIQDVEITDVTITPSIQQAFDVVKEYYRLAVKRDYALVENTLKHTEQRQSKIAILVTGGFHTQGMTDILREKDISYVVVSPNPGADDYEKVYIDRMAGAGLDVKSLAKFFAETLVIPLITSDTAKEERINYAKNAFALIVGLQTEAARLQAADSEWNPFTYQEIPSLLGKIKESLDLYGAVNANDLFYIVHEIVIDSRMHDFQPIDDVGYGMLLDDAIDRLEMEYGENGVQIAETLKQLRAESRVSVVRGLPDSIDGHAGKEGIYLKRGKVSVENILHEALAYSLELDHGAIEDILQTNSIPDVAVFSPIPDREQRRIRDFAAGGAAQAGVVDVPQIYGAITQAAAQDDQERVNQLAALILNSVERKLLRGEYEAARELLSSFTSSASPATLAMITDTRMELLRHTLNVFNGLFLFSPDTQQLLSLDERARAVRENVEINQWADIYRENQRLLAEYNNVYKDFDDTLSEEVRVVFAEFNRQNQRWNSADGGEIIGALTFFVNALDSLDFSNPYIINEFSRLVWESHGDQPVDLREIGMEGFRQMTFLQHTLIRNFNDRLAQHIAEQKEIPVAAGWNQSQPVTDNLAVYIDRLKRGDVPEVGVVPDIHGNHDRLIDLLDHLVLERGVERLVFLGDLFDRGTQNKEVFETIRNIKDTGQYKGRQLTDVQILMGNHDLFFILAMLGDMMSFVNWFNNGGNVAIENFTGLSGKRGNLLAAMQIFEQAKDNEYLLEISQWMMANMELYHVDPDHGTMYIHAGVPLDRNGNLTLEYRGLTGAQALEAMSNDLQTVLSDPELRRQAKEFNEQTAELNHIRGEEREELSEKLAQLSMESSVGILSFLNNTGSPIWVRSGQWFGVLAQSARFQEYIAVLADETAQAQQTGRIRSEMETYMLGLTEELEQVDDADVDSVAHIKSVRAVTGFLINLIRIADGELTPDLMSAYDGSSMTAMMQVLSPADFESLQNLFSQLEDSLTDVQAVENAVVEYLQQLVKTHDKKFDDLFKELGITGVVFGHTPGESVKAIKGDVFGIDMYIVEGYGGVMQIGKSGIIIDGSFEENGAVESLDAGVLIPDRIQHLEARLQRYQQADDTPVAADQEVTVVTRLTLDRLHILAYQKSLLLEGIDTLLQDLAQIDGLENQAVSEPLLIPDSAEPVQWLQENMNSRTIDFSDTANQFRVANALKQVILPSALSDGEEINFDAETRAVQVLQTFFDQIKNLPQTQQTQIGTQVANQVDAADQTQTATELLQTRTVLMREIFPLLQGANLADFDQINPNYVDQDKIIGSVSQDMDSLDFTDQYIVQSTALRLVLAIDPSYLIKQNVIVSSLRNFSVQRITAEVNLLRDFLNRIQIEDTLTQDLSVAPDFQVERLDTKVRLRAAQEQLYENLSPMMVTQIRAIVAALNNNVAEGVRILTEGEIRDLSPQEAWTFSVARAEYNAALEKQGLGLPPFSLARTSLMTALRDRAIKQQHFLAPDSIRNQMAQLDLIELLQPLADIANEQIPAVRVVEATSSDATQEILMIEDVNGDLPTVQNTLRAAGLINNQNLWIGGEGVDVLQLGVKSKDVHAFFAQLAVQAKQAGSRIVRLVGQEELRIVKGEFGNAANPLGARGWESTEDARNALNSSIRNGAIQVAQLVNGKLIVNGTISFNMKRQLISEIASENSIEQYKVTDAMIVDYLNELFRDAVTQNDFSHAIFQDANVSGIVIADSGIAAEGFESIVHETIDTAFAQGKLEVYKRGIGGKKIILVGDDTLRELAPGQRGHAGIKRNAIYIARGAVTVDGRINELNLQKLALHEAIELQRWQDEAVKLYLSNEYESLISAGYIQLGDDNRDRYAQDSDTKLAEHRVDQGINNIREYHNQLRTEYLAHLSGWAKLDTAGRSRQWNELSPWMRRELRKMLRAWSIAYKDRALRLSEQFHEEAQRISPVSDIDEAVPDVRRSPDSQQVITAPLETVSVSPAEITVYESRDTTADATASSEDIGLLIAEFARLDGEQMKDTVRALETLRSIRNRLAVSFSAASPAQVTQLERLVESRRKIVQFNAFQPDYQQALLGELVGINKIMTEQSNVLDADIVTLVSTVLDSTRQPDPIAVRRLENRLQRLRFDQVIEQELLIELFRNPDLIRQINAVAFTSLVNGLQSFMAAQVGNEVFNGTVQNATLENLQLLRNLVPVILDRVERPGRNGLRNAFVNVQNRRARGTGNQQKAEQAKRFARDFEQMLAIIESGVATQGIFTGESGLPASQRALSGTAANGQTAYLQVKSGTVAAGVRRGNDIEQRPISRIGGALKTVLDEDIQPIAEQVQSDWSALVADAELRDITVADLDITAKFIVAEKGMPDGMFAYHFKEEETDNLVIVLQTPIDEATLLELEAAYHESREFYWINELTPQDVSVSGEQQTLIRTQAHILASAEQVYIFGGENGITPFHTQLIQAMSDTTIENLLVEDRAAHHALYAGHLPDYVAERVESYEQRFVQQIRQQRLGQDRILYIQRFLESLGLANQPELRNQLVTIADTFVVAPTTPLAAELLASVGIESKAETVVATDELIQQPLITLVSDLIRTSNQDVTASGYLFLAVQNLVIDYLQEARTEKPFNMDNIERGVELTNSSI